MTLSAPLRSHEPKQSVTYFSELKLAMEILAQKPNTIFMGQGVGNAGTTLSPTFESLPPEQRLEMPVAEDMQMGMAIGMALEGYLPICVFPRWNFMLCCANQLINHLDRLPLYSDGGYQPKVIIRTAIPSAHPFDPGPQHDDDFTAAFTSMARTLKFVRLTHAESIVPAYMAAAESATSTVLVEYTEHYKNERAR